MIKKITIDPITRLEGHGRIEIFLDENGDVEKGYFIVPELRGFEIFVKGKPAEDMPIITPRICGVCPTAHHIASTKALDSLYKVEPTNTAKKLREMLYNMFMIEDHALHFYFLGGPDFIVGPTANKAERNVLGVIQKVGIDVGKKVISMRREIRELMIYLTGKVIHPVWGVPGGVTKGINEEYKDKFVDLAKNALDFSLFTLQVFKDIVLKNKDYVSLITSDTYTHKTYYMGLVDEKNKLNFYDGMIRVIDPDGKEFAKFKVNDYKEHLAEHVENWTYIKFLYLRNIGWKGFVDGKDSGVYSVAPLARLNVADGMATPKAQDAYKEFFETLGGKPVHHTLANHWARVIEMVYSGERFFELATDSDIAKPDIRKLPTDIPDKGFGVVEAPRGTLIHHYETDQNGYINKANLLVATQNNAARIAMSVEKAAKNLIKKGKVDDGILNMIEMAFRAYDPCHGCGTHALPGQMPLVINIRNNKGEIIEVIKH